MREIKFRGKRIDTNEWIYGDLLTEYYNHNRMYCISEDTAFVTDIDGTFDDNNLTIIDSIHEVLPKTVGQFIGHKDRNKIEIYVGDIIKNYYRENCFIIEWDSETSGYTQVNKTLSCNFFMDYVKEKLPKYNLEIIGNIHDK